MGGFAKLETHTQLNHHVIFPHSQLTTWQPESKSSVGKKRTPLTVDSLTNDHGWEDARDTDTESVLSFLNDVNVIAERDKCDSRF